MDGWINTRTFIFVFPCASCLHSSPSASASSATTSSQSSYTSLAFLGFTFLILFDVDSLHGEEEEWVFDPPFCQPPEMAEPVALPEVGPEPGPDGGGEAGPGGEPGGESGPDEPGLLGFEMGAAEGAGGGGGEMGLAATGVEDVVGEGGAADVADSPGGGTGALVAGGEVPVPIGGGTVVAEVLVAGAPGPGAGPPEGRVLEVLEAGALGTADEGAPLGVGVVELPFNPAPPSNLPAKHCVMSGTSVSPVGTRERT